MKGPISLIILLMTCLAGRSQLVLNQGESWTYSFNSLPKTGFTNSFQTSAQGIFEFTVHAGTLQSGELLKYEMFENAASELPICSQTLAFGSPLTATCSSPGAWSDIQGVVKLSMLSGSLTVDNVHLEAIVPGPSLSSYDVYSTSFTPVPEPSTWVLGAAALAGLGIKQLRRNREGSIPAS